MAPPRFSIAVPVRNGASFLREALDSALAQTYPAMEIVISDNASTDATPQICAEFTSQFPQIRYSRSDALLPVGQNWNRVCRMASGDWVRLLAHDDLLRSDYLERVAQELANLPGEWAGSLALIGTGEQWLFPDGTYHSPPRLPTGSAAIRFDAPAYVRLWARSTPAVPLHATAIIRRSVFDSQGFAEWNWTSNGDVFFYLQLCCHYNYLYIPDELAVNRIQQQSVTATLAKGARPVQENRRFINEFLRSEGDVLRLDPLVRLRLLLKPCAMAATQIAVNGVLRGRGRVAWNSASAVAAWQLPFLPALLIRSLRRENRRLRRSGLPAEVFYQ